MGKFGFYVRGGSRGFWLPSHWLLAAHSGLRAQNLFNNASLALSAFPAKRSTR